MSRVLLSIFKASSNVLLHNISKTHNIQTSTHLLATLQKNFVGSNRGNRPKPNNMDQDFESNLDFDQDENFSDDGSRGKRGKGNRGNRSFEDSGENDFEGGNLDTMDFGESGFNNNQGQRGPGRGRGGNRSDFGNRGGDRGNRFDRRDRGNRGDRGGRGGDDRRGGGFSRRQIDYSNVPLSKNRLMILNLNYSATADDIKQLVKEFGNVTDVVVPPSKFNASQNDGKAFVTFEKDEDCQAAVSKLHNFEYNQRELRVYFAKERPTTSNRPQN